MNLFHSSSDLLTRPLEPAMAAVCADVRELVELLGVDSYAQMGRTESARAGQLEDLAARLDRALGRPAILTKDTPWGAADWEAAYAFAQAFRLSALYPGTVGNDCKTTLPTPTFACVRPARPDPAHHAATFHRLCERIGLDVADREAIEEEARNAQRRLAQRHRLVELLRTELQADPALPPTATDAHRLFRLLFPDDPLLAGEVEVVATATCIYFCILSQDAFARTETYLARSDEARQQVTDYLKGLRQFNFYNFAHFPAFSSFDAREMDARDLDRLGGAMGLERAELIALLNTAVFIEERDQLEKYLVHDSWGHFWQADLTRLGTLYDRMASLQLPLSPSETARVDERLLSFVDLVYLRRDGALVFDEALAQRYAVAWMHERLQALLAPLIAELSADMIEYRTRRECAAAGLQLPSSSVFAQHPAKIDFAWADLSFFVKSLKKINVLYQKDEELKAGFVERARLLFRLKSRRNWPAVTSPETLETELRGVLERLLAIFHEVQETHLGLQLAVAVDTEGRPHINAFFQVLLNMLQIASTINGIVHGQLEDARPHLAPYYQTLLMFIVKYFERDPLREFWALDETLAAYAIPLLEALAACDSFPAA